MAEASKAYSKATSSTVKFLIAENDRMVKNLQEAKKIVEKSTGSTMTEMKRAIVVKILNLEATM